MTGLRPGQLVDLIGRVREIVSLEWEQPPVGRPHVLPLPTAAFFISGIAERWAGHLTDGGPGMIGDGGYQGTGPITPHKKPPGAELTAKQKAYNYSVNRLRAAVERAISHMKNWKILKTGYHRIMTKFPDMLRTVTALEIFRTTAPGFE